MADTCTKLLSFGLQTKAYTSNWRKLCCYEVPPFTYEQFIDQLNTAYTTSCKKDQVFYEYGSKLLQQCFSGGSSGSGNNTWVNSAAVNCTTDVVTFTNTTGGTFTLDLSCVGGASDYWSGGTAAATIVNSGASTTKVVIGGESAAASAILTVDGNTRATGWIKMTDGQYFYPDHGNLNTFIRGTNDDLYIASDDIMYLSPDSDLYVQYGTTNYGFFDGSVLSLGIGELPTGRATLGTPNQSTFKIHLNSEEECLTTPTWMDMYSGIDNTKLGIGERTPSEESPILPMIITPALITDEGTFTYQTDLVLGAAAKSTACSLEVLRVAGTSKVGILNATPTYTLDVTGTFRSTSNAIIGGTCTIQSIAAAGAAYTGNKILVSDGGVVEYLTAAQLKDDMNISSYWSGNTDGSISPSGLTTYVGIGTKTPDKTFHVKTDENTVAVFESTDATVTLKLTDSSDDAYIIGKNNLLYISSNSGNPNANAKFAFDYVNGRFGIGTTAMDEALVVEGNISATTNVHVSGRTYMGTVDAAGASYSNNEILVRQGTGEVEYLTASQLAQSVVYWSASTTGGHIVNSGLTGYVGIGTDTPGSLFEVKDLIKHNTSRGSTFYGYLSGQHIVDNGTTVNNTAIGKWSMSDNTYGNLNGASYNTAVGAISLYSLTTGDYNTAIGNGSQQNTTTANHNTSVGHYAGAGSIPNNSYNTAIGSDAQRYTQSIGQDTYNTSVGYGSMNSGKSFYSTAIGAMAQGYIWAVNGCTGCTSVGYKALYNAGTTPGGAEKNIAIGFQAGDSITTGANNLLIGYDVDTTSATADYELNIGNIIYGNDEYSESKIGNVGINYNDPKTVLDVHHRGNDLTSMALNTGGGEVIYFGLNDEEGESPLAAGKLMYLDTDFYWKYTDANAVGTGGSQLLALALGTAVSDGLLIRGFFHLNPDEIQGTYDEGLPCYVSEETGSIDFTAPTAASAYVRVIGYAISQVSEEPRVIYFTPDNTWVELS